jgi:peptidoglycan/LPS O-acetylase OafA/YrhL
MTEGRRYDIDWLRVIAIGLLLIYHIAVSFQPWASFIGFIKSNVSLETVWIPMTLLNVWRIPLLFFVSGMGVCFAMRKRNWKQLLLDRSLRILLPLIFGSLTIVPLHRLLWQKYYHQPLEYIIYPDHLWFLGNIFAYVLILLPLFYFLKEKPENLSVRWFLRVFSSPFMFGLMLATWIGEALLVEPMIYVTYAFTLHGFALGFISFFFGFCCVINGEYFWSTVLRYRWVLLLVSISLFLNRFIRFDQQLQITPNYLLALESLCWVLTIFGLGRKYLNKPGPVLTYLSQGSYPIYIIHMLFLYLGCYFIFPLDIPVYMQFLLVVAITAIGSWVTYELIIRRINVLRPLFGMKWINKTMR